MLLSRGTVSKNPCPFWPVPWHYFELIPLSLCPVTIKGHLSLCPVGQENPVPLETLVWHLRASNVQVTSTMMETNRFTVAKASRKLICVNKLLFIPYIIKKIAFSRLHFSNNKAIEESVRIFHD